MNPRDIKRKKQFYKEYFEGDEKPKLLKKESVINRRFELFKKIDRMLLEISHIEGQNVSNPQYKTLTEGRLNLVKKLATLNNVRPQEVGATPESQ